MPRRRLKIKLDKLRLGISFVLAVVSYNILDWMVELNYDTTIWIWLKSQDVISRSILTVMLAWIMLLIVPILIWFKVVGLYISRQNQK